MRDLLHAAADHAADYLEGVDERRCLRISCCNRKTTQADVERSVEALRGVLTARKER